jgi:hypothetical protein
MSEPSDPPTTPTLPLPSPEVAADPPGGPVQTLRDLLNTPLVPLERARLGDPTGASALAFGGLLSIAVYGLVAGTFQGGANILGAALKGPLIVLVTLLLCAPSLWVFSSLAGVRWTVSAFGTVLASIAALAGMVLVGLLPVAWLFGASSRLLGFVTVVHFICWAVALGLAGGYLKRALAVLGGRGGAGLWTILALAVSLQVATTLRPILWREAGAPTFTGEKLFFLEHFEQAAKKRQPRDESPEASTSTPGALENATP